MNFNRNLSTGVLTLAALVGAGCLSSALSGSPEPTASVQSDLVGGDAGDPVGSGALYIQSESSICTGVMIGPHQILTAAHCVAVRTAPPPMSTQHETFTGVLNDGFLSGKQITLTNSPATDIYASWTTATVYLTSIHPSFVAACQTPCEFFQNIVPSPSDLAIVTVVDPLPACFGLPAELDSALDGDAVVEVGYGCENGIGKGAPDPHRFKMAPTTVRGIDDPFFAAHTTTFTDADEFLGSYFVTDGIKQGGGASLCSGDSGGPVFKGDFSNGGHVVGINSASFRNNDDSGISTMDMFARVDSPATQAWVATVLGNAPKTALPPPYRGEPADDSGDPVASLFPLSTVGLTAFGSDGCTGVILGSQSILTAAHCHVDSDTTIELYSTKGDGNAEPTDTIPGSAVVGFDKPPGVECSREATGWFPDTCYSQLGSHIYADLQVLKLNTDIPDDYKPVILGPSGSYGARHDNVSWMVATGGGGTMQWSPTSSIMNDDDTGVFTAFAPFGLWGDSGGPLFQYATDEDIDADQPNLVLIGLASAIGPQHGPCLALQPHLESFTSVVQPDVYKWLVDSEGALTAPPDATFGTAE